MTFESNCALCRLVRHDDYPKALHSELFYEDEYLIVVEDDDPKGFEVRLLAVWKDHVPVGQLAGWAVAYMNEKLLRTAWTIGKERELKMVNLDTKNHSMTKHEHWQAGMERL